MSSRTMSIKNKMVKTAYEVTITELLQRSIHSNSDNCFLSTLFQYAHARCRVFQDSMNHFKAVPCRCSRTAPQLYTTRSGYSSGAAAVVSQCRYFYAAQHLDMTTFNKAHDDTTQLQGTTNNYISTAQVKGLTMSGE